MSRGIKHVTQVSHMRKVSKPAKKVLEAEGILKKKHPRIYSRFSGHKNCQLTSILTHIHMRYIGTSSQWLEIKPIIRSFLGLKEC